MSNSADDQVFDKQATLERMAFDAQLFGEMIDLLSQDGPRRLNELQRALQAADLPRVRHAAHSLKGLAANFNATRTVQAAAQIEKVAKSGEFVEQLPDAVAELSEALHELLEELAQHRPASRLQPAAAMRH
jgi:HPt (histidine-containing phosphotransfer) domain-containing protein